MKRLFTLASAVIMAAPGATQTPVARPAGYGSPITVGDALRLIDRGIEKSAAKGIKMTIAVVATAIVDQP